MFLLLLSVLVHLSSSANNYGETRGCPPVMKVTFRTLDQCGAATDQSPYLRVVGHDGTNLVLLGDKKTYSVGTEHTKEFHDRPLIFPKDFYAGLSVDNDEKGWSAYTLEWIMLDIEPVGVTYLLRPPADPLDRMRLDPDKSPTCNGRLVCWRAGKYNCPAGTAGGWCTGDSSDPKPECAEFERIPRQLKGAEETKLFIDWSQSYVPVQHIEKMVAACEWYYPGLKQRDWKADYGILVDHNDEL